MIYEIASSARAQHTFERGVEVVAEVLQILKVLRHSKPFCFSRSQLQEAVLKQCCWLSDCSSLRLQKRLQAAEAERSSTRKKQVPAVQEEGEAYLSGIVSTGTDSSLAAHPI
ncbi:hypothetical protein WJX74_004276 [Apatococcus lobatus]|uniref:Uncharacterized protein n=1 Tax=Apatococcus lobatus TaxID=904363 RepID=A0AAW1RAX3_9CHLO